MCNSSSCLWCIKSPNKCTKCQFPLVLDVPTSQCKPCCAKTVPRRLNSPACCECSQEAKYEGVCVRKLPNAFQTETRSWNGWTVVLVILLLIALVLLAYSIFFLKKSLSNKSTVHQNVKYSALIDEANHD